MRSGDGGPSIAGSIMSLKLRAPWVKPRPGEVGGETAVLGGSVAAFRRPPRPTVNECIVFRA